MALLNLTAIHAQSTLDGYCGEDVKWYFDGSILKIECAEGLYNPMNDYNYNVKENIAPWLKRKLDIIRVVVGKGVTSIGSCAFAGCDNLREVIFEGTRVTSIGWGAFLNCTRLYSISLPVNLSHVGKAAFANCRSLDRIRIPAQCRVEDQAFASCDNLQSIDCAPTAVLGQLVFVKERHNGDKVEHIPYSGDIIRIPPYVNANNCHIYGLAKESIEKVKAMEYKENYDEVTSELDKNIPSSGSGRSRADTYALIIGNQKYRFASEVTYAIHDARVFREYCEKTLGIPSRNIHIVEDATKQMIMEEELEDWLGVLRGREAKRLIVYYAGHGVPDTKNNNKSYLLPTDVQRNNPKRGIALDDFYAKIANLDFAQTSIFLDACFSGSNRNGDGVGTDERGGAEIDVDETPINDGKLVIFSAAQGNETALGYPEQGHGLFTYFLLDEIRKSKGDVKFGEMFDNIRNGVYNTASNLKIRKRQTPSKTISEYFEDDWRYLSF